MSKEISLAEVKKHKDRKSLWIVIHNDVYDVTKFLEEHPGGEDTLLDVAGRDGTQEFEDVGHSDDARELLKKYKIGSLPEAECGSDHHILSCHSHTILRPQIAHEPKPERRVQSIVVPQESAKLKWLLVALAGAIVIGVVVKKYSSSH